MRFLQRNLYARRSKFTANARQRRNLEMKENYTDLVYILSSLAAMLVFSASLVIYLTTKKINIYLVALGLVMLGVGVIVKRRLDKIEKL